MKVVGVIAEYNPFHLGHQYQLEEIKRITHADVILVLMSGNVVQRGEFAILSKWERAKLALDGGADVIIEMPLISSLQGADYFTKYNIDLMHQLGVDIIAFGTETANLTQLNDYVTQLDYHQQNLEKGIKYFLSRGYSYPASYGKAIQQLKINLTFDINSPNHILAIQYVKWNKLMKKPKQMLVIPRREQFLSGSQIRQEVANRTLSCEQVPIQTFSTLQKTTTTHWEDYFGFLKYQLLIQSKESLADIIFVREGIEHLLLKQISNSEHYDQFINRLTSLRWTKTAIQRILIGILLNITKNEFEQSRKELENLPTLRLLGFNDSGRRYLNDRKRYSNVQLMNNYNQSQGRQFSLNVRADKIYRLVNPNLIEEQNYTKHAIYKNKM